MYPIIRFAKEALLSLTAGTIMPDQVHVSRLICWPWDVDLWLELNNGRALTLYDLGRIPLCIRLNMLRELRRRGWGMAVAGASVRYRRRVRMFQRLTMKSALLGWDERFFYFQQTIWHGNMATSSILVRSAVTTKNGILPPAELAELLGWPEQSPELPDHVQDWIRAEGKRPWPPHI
ncbi:MAG: acyl-CoA thioesterase [Rhodobacteraceae bacterium]|nr:acyl-CoA thioesterase [Paracoccaceae bacterium]